MGAVYATVADLIVHWPKFPVGSEDEAEQKLLEASIEVRSNFPDVDRRLSLGVLDAEVPRLVVCRMVKRALNVDDAEALPTGGMESVQFGAGPFQFSGKPSNPDGNIYMSAGDKRLLRPHQDTQAFSIHPGPQC